VARVTIDRNSFVLIRHSSVHHFSVSCKLAAR